MSKLILIIISFNSMAFGLDKLLSHTSALSISAGIVDVVFGIIALIWAFRTKLLSWI